MNNIGNEEISVINNINDLKFLYDFLTNYKYTLCNPRRELDNFFLNANPVIKSYKKQINELYSQINRYEDLINYINNNYKFNMEIVITTEGIKIEVENEFISELAEFLNNYYGNLVVKFKDFKIDKFNKYLIYEYFIDPNLAKKFLRFYFEISSNDNKVTIAMINKAIDKYHKLEKYIVNHITYRFNLFKKIMLISIELKMDNNEFVYKSKKIVADAIASRNKDFYISLINDISKLFNDENDKETERWIIKMTILYHSYKPILKGNSRIYAFFINNKAGYNNASYTKIGITKKNIEERRRELFAGLITNERENIRSLELKTEFPGIAEMLFKLVYKNRKIEGEFYNVDEDMIVVFFEFYIKMEEYLKGVCYPISYKKY